MTHTNCNITPTTSGSSINGSSAVVVNMHQRRLRGRTIAWTTTTTTPTVATAAAATAAVATPPSPNTMAQIVVPHTASDHKSTTNAMKTTISSKARAGFVTATRAAVDMLMQQHGYSRDHAVATLLRQISTHNNSSDTSLPGTTSLSRPNDHEVRFFAPVSGDGRLVQLQHHVIDPP